MTETRDVLDELLPLFQSECEERLNAISGALSSVEDSDAESERLELLEVMLRELHSLKGGARAVNLDPVEEVSHAFESVLVGLQDAELQWSGEVIDACHQAVEVLGDLVMASSDDDRDLAAETARLLAGLRAEDETGSPGAEPGTSAQPSHRAEPDERADPGGGSAPRSNVEPAPSAPVVPTVVEEPLSPEEQELLRKLLPVFRAEAEERLESIANALEELRAGPATEREQELFESVMRDAHSLKGGGRTMKLVHVSAVCQKFEFAAAQLTRQEVPPYPELYDLFERAADLVQELLETPEKLNEGRIHQMIEDLASIDQRVPQVAAELVRPMEPVQPSLVAPGTVAKRGVSLRAAQTVRVATEKLDNVLRQAQEMLVSKLAMRQRSSELREIAGLLRQWQSEWSRVDTDVYRLQSWVEKNDEQTDPSGTYSLAVSAVRFLEWSQKSVRALETQVRELGKHLFDDQQSFAIMVDTLVDDTKRALMLPLSTLFKGLPRMVREVARSQKKAVDFEVRGDDVELDKGILDEMRDPLMHMLRNCVDHGIEASLEREARGKPKRGRIVIEVSQPAADEVEMLVRDDGAGIDTDRVRAAAVKNGVMTDSQAETLDREALLQLIFRSGVSTSKTVSNISGRGLGMAICREGVERLGGRITIESEVGRGTSFRIVLPLALATYRVLLVEAGRQVLAVPTANTERVVRLTEESVVRVNGKDTINEQGRPVLLQSLESFLGTDVARPSERRRPIAAILRSGERRVAFTVDRVLDEQEVLFKDLGSYLVHIPNVSGATILGTGKVVPILNAPEMIDAVYAENVVSMAAPVEVDAAPPVEEAPTRSILVVEDSITSRMLLKEILESAGYIVATAINGAEAVTTLEQEQFDLVVSDVEMPRMNGFELTEHIRAHERWSSLPVILVTGLERDEERARGLAAGANEYIIKGSFEQSNLLEAIRRFCGDS